MAQNINHQKIWNFTKYDMSKKMKNIKEDMSQKIMTQQMKFSKGWNVRKIYVSRKMQCSKKCYDTKYLISQKINVTKY